MTRRRYIRVCFNRYQSDEMPKDKRKRKSAKRVARGKRLAKALPRDKKGRFLPAGSKNLFRKKRGRKRSKSAPARRKRKQPIKRAKLTRRRSVKMARGRTKDDFPNFLSGALVMTGAQAFTEQQIFTPIPRLKVTGNRATVMELLYVDFVGEGTDMNGIGDRLQFQMFLGTSQSVILSWADTRVFMHYQLDVSGLTSGFAQITWPRRFSFMDERGFGYLLAADSFRTSADTTGQAGAVTFAWKLYYRFVDIPLSEFIGIVQSTQAS